MKRSSKVLLFFVLILAVITSVAAQESPAPVTVPVEDITFRQVNYQGVRFTFDASLAKSVSVVDYPATDGEGFMPSPAFSEFMFNDYGAGENYVQFAPQPRISIFAVDDFGPFPYYAEQVNALEALLATRPDLNTYVYADVTDPSLPDLPFLPMFPAAQVFRAQPAYLQMNGLAGIRYLVYYSQAANPIADGEVFYTFQGVTTDGEYYVSLILPVGTGLLSEEDAPDYTADDFITIYTEYLTRTVQTLNTADPEMFMPALSTLDAVALSILVRR